MSVQGGASGAHGDEPLLRHILQHPAGVHLGQPDSPAGVGAGWIIAGGIFFSLLVWQGVKMTYDIWIEPQPAVGFRQLVPRFLLAIALAAGSLYISQLVLILASDVTCFVAQSPG